MPVRVLPHLAHSIWKSFQTCAARMGKPPSNCMESTRAAGVVLPVSHDIWSKAQGKTPAAKANHTQKSSSVPTALASPLPASRHWPAPASLPWSSQDLKLLCGSEIFCDHHRLRSTDVFEWNRSVNPIALVKWHPGLLWTRFATAMMGAKSLLGPE